MIYVNNASDTKLNIDRQRTVNIYELLMNNNEFSRQKSLTKAGKICQLKDS